MYIIQNVITWQWADPRLSAAPVRALSTARGCVKRSGCSISPPAAEACQQMSNSDQLGARKARQRKTHATHTVRSVCVCAGVCMSQGWSSGALSLFRYYSSGPRWCQTIHPPHLQGLCVLHMWQQSVKCVSLLLCLLPWPENVDYYFEV